MDVNTRLKIYTLVSAGALILASFTLANPASASRPMPPDDNPRVHPNRTPSVDGDRLLVIPVSGIAAGRHGGVIRFMSRDKVLRSVRFHFDSGDAEIQSLLLPVDGGDPTFVQRLRRIAQDPASSVEIGVLLDGREYPKFTLAEVEDMSRGLLSQGPAIRIATLSFVHNVVNTAPAPKLKNLSALTPECDANYLQNLYQIYGECLDRCEDGQAGASVSCLNGCESYFWEWSYVGVTDEWTEETLVYETSLSGPNPNNLECYSSGWWIFSHDDLYERFQRLLRVRTIRRWTVCGQIVDEVLSESLVSDICFKFRFEGGCTAYDQLPCHY